MTLTADEWDIIEDALVDAIATADDLAQMWTGRGRYERYKGEADRTRAVYEKVKAQRLGPPVVQEEAKTKS